MKRGLLLAPFLLMAACSGGASSGEDTALNDAAASLDANSPDTNAAEIVDDDEGDDENETMAGNHD